MVTENKARSRLTIQNYFKRMRQKTCPFRERPSRNAKCTEGMAAQLSAQETAPLADYTASQTMQTNESTST